MLRNILAATLRSLARDWLYAAITIIGLAVGFTAAIMIGLFVRDEFSYDRWLPLHERTYLLRASVETTGRPTDEYDFSPAYFAAPMKLDFPQVEAIARITGGNRGIRRGSIENIEYIYWADPNFFDLIRLPAIAGDLATALEKPDGIVLTRALARKYFGRDDPIGETLEIDRQNPMTVTAVIEDMPSNFHLDINAVASGRAAFSPLTRMDTTPPQGFEITCLTYLRLAPGATGAELEREFPGFLTKHKWSIEDPGSKRHIIFTALADIHFARGSLFAAKPRGNREVVLAIGAIGILIVIIAAINFVNLMTARAARRGTEVGLRKTAGAARKDLIMQFLGESMIYVVIGTAAALILVWELLPSLNAFLDRTIAFDWWYSGAYVAGFIGVVLAVGVLAGAYPALVLSSFRPASVIKPGGIQGGGSSAVRRGLVVLQFAMLIGLILSAGVIYRQMQFALNEGMRIDTDQVYLISNSCRDGFNSGFNDSGFKDQVAALPGVRGVACSSGVAMNYGNVQGVIKIPDGTTMSTARYQVDFGFFEFYGLTPVSGRFFAREHPGDAVPIGFPEENIKVPVVINETAARRFGFVEPAKAVGAYVEFPDYGPWKMDPSEIIGVVPDFAVDAVHTEIPPIVYIAHPMLSNLLNVRLSGRDIPDTLAAIDRLWTVTEMGATRPITRTFLDERVQDMYRDITQQGVLFAVFAGVAFFIASIGLFGMSAYSAARRTKEIGIRKATGAASTDILRLLNWEFVRPVLWANLIAWPIAYWVMQRWLEGFAYHIDLQLWMFAAAGASALVIALATVSVHSWIVARAKPVTALRYE